jgi:phosphoserine phosphatase
MLNFSQLLKCSDKGMATMNDLSGKMDGVHCLVSRDAALAYTTAKAQMEMDYLDFINDFDADIPLTENGHHGIAVSQHDARYGISAKVCFDLANEDIKIG